MVITSLRGISSELFVPGIRKEKSRTAASMMNIYIKPLRFQLEPIIDL
jgi:hypothetical protein